MKYKDKVRIKTGFYEGAEGELISEEMSLYYTDGTNPVKSRCKYLVSINEGPDVHIEGDNLELI